MTQKTERGFPDRYQNEVSTQLEELFRDEKHSCNRLKGMEAIDQTNSWIRKNPLVQILGMVPEVVKTTSKDRRLFLETVCDLEDETHMNPFALIS